MKALPELPEFEAGLLHLFLQHTSASLTINENASPEVLGDLERHFNQLAPEEAPYYRHTIEGPDDMPSHLKSSLLGTWQGICLCEHRERGGPRHLIATLWGRKG
jgi:secondary thiamine-phosphate synthase enzyme